MEEEEEEEEEETAIVTAKKTATEELEQAQVQGVLVEVEAAEAEGAEKKSQEQGPEEVGAEDVEHVEEWKMIMRKRKKTCEMRFDSYIASSYEMEWCEGISGWHVDVCDVSNSFQVKGREGVRE